MIVAAVTGSRGYKSSETVFEELDLKHAEFEIGILVHGGAAGVDLLADAWCRARGVQPAQCDALWDYWRKQGRMRVAGIRRNWAMTLLKPRVLFAFPGGNGTANMVKQCRAIGIEIVPCGGALWPIA
jgi:hypothetical protein